MTEQAETSNTKEGMKYINRIARPVSEASHLVILVAISMLHIERSKTYLALQNKLC